jgi:hypothetical protein
MFPKGTYMTIEELNSRTPSSRFCNYQFVKRSSSDIVMTGGNDYRIESKNDSVTKKNIKKTIFAISTGDTLFINDFKYKLQFWYSIARLDGDYLYFRASTCMDFKSPIATSGPQIGAISGAIQAKDRYLYYLNLKTGVIHIMTNSYLKNVVLKNQIELLSQFEKEINKDEKTFVKYFKLANKID